MSESMREAVEGFERDERGTVFAFPPSEYEVVTRRWSDAFLSTASHVMAVYFTGADILDLATAINDERATAIAAPRLAESCNALADRLENLAARLGAIVPDEIVRETPPSQDSQSISVTYRCPVCALEVTGSGIVDGLDEPHPQRPCSPGEGEQPGPACSGRFELVSATALP